MIDKNSAVTPSKGSDSAEANMLMSATERLIQLKRIAVLTDLESDSEKVLRYAASLARWYGSELLIAHACAHDIYLPLTSEPLPSWPVAGLNPKQDALEKLKSLTTKLNLGDLTPKVVVHEGTVAGILKDLGEYHPNLLVLGTHGRDGIRNWLVGSVAEGVFRKVQWPVLMLGPGFTPTEAAPQKQFERVLYSTDLSGVSVTALQYAAGISHDHEAQLIALYVESDPEKGFSFDRPLAELRLQEWLQDRIDGLAEALVGVHRLIEFGKPELKILEVAAGQQADLVVLGARGLGAVSGFASHFLGGTAYEVVCSSKCPVLIVPQPT
jgi:nucleotide-binding universal stress UspA family protein